MWPDSLVRELAERRCIIVLGAGASMYGRHGAPPPSWKGLLEGALPLVPAVQSQVVKLIRSDRLLDAAQLIRVEANEPDFVGYLQRQLSAPGTVPTAIHEAVRDLDAKVVVTTNYDQLYERCCQSGADPTAYQVLKFYDDHFLDSLRSPQRIIVKAHGCISAANRIVLTRAEYFDARRHFASFYRILDSLFLVNTLLFIGCGMTDPDLNLLLENVNIAVPSSFPHYALVPKQKLTLERTLAKRVYNVKYLEYSVRGGHVELEAVLKDLVAAVVDARRLYR